MTVEIDRRLPSVPERDQARATLITRTRALRAEIQRYCDDAATWNRDHPREQINPDPDGQLARIAAGLDATLAREEAANS